MGYLKIYGKTEGLGLVSFRTPQELPTWKRISNTLFMFTFKLQPTSLTLNYNITLTLSLCLHQLYNLNNHHHYLTEPWPKAGEGNH